MHVGPMMKGVVHGINTTCHFLGLLYNASKKNWKMATFHGLAITFDGLSVYNHMKEQNHG